MSEAIIEDYRHELTRFTVDTVRILLDFGAVKADFSNNAEIIEIDGAIDRIDDVWDHQGHLQPIWRLLGRSMTGFVMDEDSFRLTFEDGAMIRCKYEKSYDFVTVWGPDPRYEAGYPSALGSPDPKVVDAMRQMMEGPGPKLFFPLPIPPITSNGGNRHKANVQSLCLLNQTHWFPAWSRVRSERRSRLIKTLNFSNSPSIQRP